MKRDRTATFTTAAILSALLGTAAVHAGEWTFWRGPYQNGVSPETGLVSSWSREGQNLIWRRDFTGRSTPVVFDGRVCANGRAGEGDLRQEVVACWNAENGDPLWERRFTVYHTAVPWNRVGWSSLAADAETGNVYALNVDGELVALDRQGKTVWSWRLGQDFGRASGYGGRTPTPVIDEDRLILHVIGSGWGPLRGPAADRTFAFDKRTGAVLWVSPGVPQDDLNTQSSPTVAVIGGRRLVILGYSAGTIQALEARTGEPVWSFKLSQRHINTGVVVDGTTVFATHSEENVDEGTMGRLVAIDGTGAGDVTKTNELWRVDQLSAGFPSPLLHDGILYVVENSAKLHAYDAKTGGELWTYSLGTVGKASPVWADGKIFATETNGKFHILQPSREGVTELDHEEIKMPAGDRHAEIYGSPAIAYGRIYFTTEEGVYCVGDGSKPFKREAGPAVTFAEEPPAADAKPARLRVVPFMAIMKPGESQAFEVRAYDDKGRFLGDVTPEWTVAGIPGKVAADGTLALDPQVAGVKVGSVKASFGGLSAEGWVRVGGPLPWKEDFESYEVDKFPTTWMGVGRTSKVREVDGSKVLAFFDPPTGLPRATVLMGPDFYSGYTVQADVKGTQQGRKRPDVGLVDSGYTLELQGGHQRLTISSWTSEQRASQNAAFAWDMDTWYTLKLRVDTVDDGKGGRKSVARGKAWKRDEPEPAEWTITAEDPFSIPNGAPGLYCFSPVDAYFDNLQVFPN